MQNVQNEDKKIDFRSGTTSLCAVRSISSNHCLLCIMPVGEELIIMGNQIKQKEIRLDVSLDFLESISKL